MPDYKLIRYIQNKMPDFRIYIKESDGLGKVLYISRYDLKKNQDFITADLIRKISNEKVDGFIKTALNNWEYRYKNNA